MRIGPFSGTGNVDVKPRVPFNGKMYSLIKISQNN